jgi:hypothetical protein
MNRKKAARVITECAELVNAWDGWADDGGKTVWTNEEYQTALATVLQPTPPARSKQKEWEWIRDKAHVLAGRGGHKTQAEMIRELQALYVMEFPDKKPPVKDNQD